MNAWAIVYLMLLCLNAGVVLAKHGQQRKPFNGPLQLLDFGLSVLLLWLAGFFS